MSSTNLKLQYVKALDCLNDQAYEDVLKLLNVVGLTPNITLLFSNYPRTWNYVDSKTFVQKTKSETEFSDLVNFCKSKLMVVPDTEVDSAAFNHPHLNRNTPVRFYACFPIYNSQQNLIGLIQMYDHQPKYLSTSQIQGIELISKMIPQRLEKEIEIYLEKKSSEDAFYRQNEFLDAVLENLGDGVVACNDQAQLTIFNRATRIFHGLDSRSDIPSEQWSEYYSLLHADGKTPMQLNQIPLFRAYSGEILRDSEMVIDSVDGGRRNITCSGRSIFRKDGSKLGAVVTLHDITAVKQANAKVQATTKMLQGLIDACPVGIAVFDLDENIVMWNPGCEKILGWKAEEVLGQSMPYYDQANSHQIKTIHQTVRTTKKKFEGEKTRYRKDGTKVTLHKSVLPLLNESDELDGFMAVFIDISDVKQREDNLVASNRALEAAAAAKAEFLANMSHEIRTPLNGVIGMTNLVLMSDLTTEQREHLQTSQSAATNLLSIVSDILDFTKIEAGSIHVDNVNFDVTQMIDDVYYDLKEQAKGKKLNLTKSLPTSLMHEPVFVGDAQRIRQVFEHLVNNAIKFTEKGSVRTAISFENVSPKKTILRFEVKDTGIGIPAELMGKLFQPFSQADSSTTKRFSGTGLGLSLSKGLLDLMHGEIGVESIENEGSTFWFTVPVENLNSRSPEKESVLGNSPGNYRILMAEDNSMNQKIALAMLNKLGYHADVVEHGRAAVEALKTNSYDLVLMDCQMPEMDGYEATHFIRTDSALPNDIAIIAITSNAMKGDREKCLAAGMSDYMTKPVKFDALKEMLERYLGTRGALAKAS